MSYAVKEIFYTLQGEGAQAGHFALVPRQKRSISQRFSSRRLLGGRPWGSKKRSPLK